MLDNTEWKRKQRGVETNPTEVASNDSVKDVNNPQTNGGSSNMFGFYLPAK